MLLIRKEKGEVVKILYESGSSWIVCGIKNSRPNYRYGQEKFENLGYGLGRYSEGAECLVFIQIEDSSSVVKVDVAWPIKIGLGRKKFSGKLFHVIIATAPQIVSVDYVRNKEGREVCQLGDWDLINWLARIKSRL